MSDNIDELSKILEIKTNEIYRTQKLEALNMEIKETLKDIPDALKNIRKVIELIESQFETREKEIDEYFKNASNKLSQIEKDLNDLLDFVQKTNIENKLFDKNNSNSLIVQIEKLFNETKSLLSDLNNPKSMINVINTKFTEQNDILTNRDNPISLLTRLDIKLTQILNNQAKQKQIRDYITWAGVAIGAVLNFMATQGFFGG
ncbi:MAG: hypothetical protein ACOC1O_01400 [bacterium]